VNDPTTTRTSVRNASSRTEFARFTNNGKLIWKLYWRWWWWKCSFPQFQDFQVQLTREFLPIRVPLSMFGVNRTAARTRRLLKRLIRCGTSVMPFQ